MHEYLKELKLFIYFQKRRNEDWLEMGFNFEDFPLYPSTIKASYPIYEHDLPDDFYLISNLNG